MTTIRDWQRGDVVWHPEHGRGIVQGSNVEGQFIEWGSWRAGDDRSAVDDVADDLRRLVVIDPEDRVQVEGLLGSLLDSFSRDLSREVDGRDVRAAQAALREFVNPTPPKPDEPTGLGAVVEDADGKRWVNAYRDGGTEWVPSDGGRFPARYPSINAVRVLSEGVQ